MAIAIVQQVVGAAALAGASSTTVTATITPTAGNLLFVFVRGASTTATITCSDPTNGAYTQIDGRALLTNMKGWTFYKNVVAGSAVTITATWSAATTDRGMIVVEVSGQDLVSPLETWTSASVVGSGTGTDVLTTGSMTPTAQPALVLAVYSDFGGVTISSGTGFTPGTLRWNASGDSTLPEYQRITSTAGIAATWTPSGSTNGIMMGAVFKEAAAATAQPARRLPAPAWPEDQPPPPPRARRAIGIGESVGLPAVAGLKLWLRADLGAGLSGGNLVSLADQSSGGNHTTNTGTVPYGTSGLNGKPHFVTDGAAGMFGTTNPLPAGSPRTIFVVCRPTTSAGGMALALRTTAIGNLYAVTGTGSGYGATVVYYNTDITGPGSVPNQGNLSGLGLIAEWTVAGGGGAAPTFQLNGRTPPVTTPGSEKTETGASGFGVGATGIGPFNTLGSVGEIYEVLVYDSVLGAGDEAAILAYLSTRYAIATLDFTPKPRRASWDWEDPGSWPAPRRARLIPASAPVTADTVLGRRPGQAGAWWDVSDDGPRRRLRQVPTGATPPAADPALARPRGLSAWLAWEQPWHMPPRRARLVTGLGPENSQTVRPPLVALVDDLDLGVGTTQLGNAASVDSIDMAIAGDT